MIICIYTTTTICRAFNFRDAASLRLLGFDAASLRLAGFSDIAVVTAGSTAAELTDAHFSTEQLRQAGLPDHALRAVGYQTEQQVCYLIITAFAGLSFMILFIMIIVITTTINLYIQYILNIYYICNIIIL